jgi:hypothetical protein
MRYDDGVRQRSGIVFAALLAGAMLFAYRPLLDQPLLLDDVGLFHHLWAGRDLDAARSFGIILARCAFPVFFRPLAAPVFWTLYRVFGAEPLAYRLLMLAAAWACALLAGKVTARLGGGLVAERATALLYAFSWVQWSGLTMVAGLPQSLGDVLFWTALLAALRDGRPRPAPALGLAGAALLFKEHSIVWPVFALGAGASAARRLALGAAAMTAAYIGLRALAPGHDFSDAVFAPRFDPPAAVRGAGVVLKTLAGSWTARPGDLGAAGEILAALALGAAAAWASLGAGRAKVLPVRALRFSLIGVGAGLFPIWPFPTRCR